ncbi:NAD-dependent epimerase/dehydratase family protein [Mucilaginibacter conchicola]|uniref:NAD-dependent epimerase/dehydratase family protein n=1 Tax=Mucilaginibacter conchicola TaxID=2303333 RepID=A0A372NRI4_9SPHI|nr:NAD(P)H-binding protein [Mucilaginibacter conchicola]RFZ91207.1 NAD-dependent epimerase/dehydratase family protein [Mucilaginibacter conchicola]
MKILVIGGTGLIGKTVCYKLNKAGHEVVVGARSAGVDVLTGEGLAQALEGTEVVIDLSNSASPDDETALNFFRTAGKNIASAEKLAGVKHHLILSIVGTDRAQYIGYLRAKKDQEDNIINSGIPYTIIRATQFHEHIDTIISVQGEGDKVFVSTVDYQPIAAEDVTNYVVQFALGEPKQKIVEIAGPEKAPMTDFVTKYLETTGIEKTVVPNDDDKYMFFEIPKSCLVPTGDFYKGEMDFDTWIEKNK